LENCRLAITVNITLFFALPFWKETGQIFKRIVGCLKIAVGDLRIYFTRTNYLQSKMTIIEFITSKKVIQYR